MTFHSILSGGTKDGASRETREVPPCFSDLNLDQIIDAATASRQEYDLKPCHRTRSRKRYNRKLWTGMRKKVAYPLGV